MMNNIEGEIAKIVNRGFNTTEKIAKALGVEHDEMEKRLTENQYLVMPQTKDGIWELSVRGEEMIKLSGEKIGLNGFGQALSSFTDKFKMAEEFMDRQPMFYDRTKSWWIWDFKDRKYARSDDVDVMNALDNALDKQAPTIQNKEKTEIIEALKREGRRRIPQDIPPTWIQFNDRIIDIETDEEFEPTPEYFCTNPIPHRLGESEDTPNIDKVFEEWVNGNATQLQEIAAYCMLPDYPLHRIFALIGSGSNGKGKYLGFLNKLVGSDNAASTSMERLSVSRFECGSKLYKKLICHMGEINVKILEKTDTIKKASGGDAIPGEFKNKDPFDFVNYAKIIIASNSLPATTDRTDGFYRRWMVIDFPNRFSEKKDVLDDIPDEEYSNFARKCIGILKRIIREREFTSEGSIDDRRRIYEEKSNPTLLFVKKEYVKHIGMDTAFSDFYEDLKVYLESNGHRLISNIELSRILQSDGFEIKTKTVDGRNCKWILDLARKSEEVKIVKNTLSNGY